MRKQVRQVTVTIMLSVMSLAGYTAEASTPEQCVEFKQFVAEYSPTELALSDELTEMSKELHAACHDKGFDLGTQLAKINSVAGLSIPQKGVLEQLVIDRSGDVDFDVDEKSGNLSQITFRFLAIAPTEVVFFDQLYETYSAYLETLFGLAAEDSFEARWTTWEMASAGNPSVYEVKLSRVHKGVVYDGDRLSITMLEEEPGVFLLDTLRGKILK